MKNKIEELFNIVERGEKKMFFSNFNLEYSNAIDKYNYSLLQVAISSIAKIKIGNKFEIVEFLIKNNCNLNHQDKKGMTALQYLITERNYSLTALLLQSDININLEDVYGNQALWTAVFNSRFEEKFLNIINVLLQKNANPYHKNKVNRSPYQLALQFNSFELLNLFDSHLKRGLINEIH